MRAALGLLACAAACAPGAAVRRLPADARVTAIVDVTVIPMDRERELAHHTVVVRDGRILAVGPDDTISVLGDAMRIDGRGKFLLPGLADMHVHTFDERSRSLFVGMGVTTVRIMFGMPSVLRLREAVRAGREAPSPWIYTAGPILDGDPPVFPNHIPIKTPAQGAEVTHAQKRAGYDFIKVYENLSRDAYDAIVAPPYRTACSSRATSRPRSGWSTPSSGPGVDGAPRWVVLHDLHRARPRPRRANTTARSRSRDWYAGQ